MKILEGNCQFTGKKYNCANCDGHNENWVGKGRYSSHMCMSVKGPVKRDDKPTWRRLSKLITHDDRRKMTPTQVRGEFIALDYQGVHVLPICECDRFCYKNGCQGHKKKDEDV